MSSVREPTRQRSVSHPSSVASLNQHACLNPRISSPPDESQIPEKVSRKVSFSDVVITSSRVVKPNVDPATSAFVEQVTVEERRSASPVDDTAHNIIVQLINPKENELTCDSALASTELPVFEVKLGMLKQATKYHAEFIVPHALPKKEAELLRFIDETPGCVSAPVNVGANVELLSCEPDTSGPGHRLVIKLSTTKQHRVNEFFTLRLVSNPAEAVHLVLHGLSLGRGQGTPFLRLGIHRIGENSDYEDSDEFTEWPGFGNRVDEELDDDESHDPMEANQGDQPGNPEMPIS